jgi:hypothetical protein
VAALGRLLSFVGQGVLPESEQVSAWAKEVKRLKVQTRWPSIVLVAAGARLRAGVFFDYSENAARTTMYVLRERQGLREALKGL